jgi:uncharacterized small protein (DUF1192 family)
MLLKVLRTILLSEAGRRLLMEALGRIMPGRGAAAPDPAMAAVGEGLRESSARLAALEEQIARLWSETEALRREQERRAASQAFWLKALGGYALVLTALVVYLLLR